MSGLKRSLGIGLSVAMVVGVGSCQQERAPAPSEVGQLQSSLNSIPIYGDPGASQTIAQPSGTGFFVNRANNVRFADQFPGSDAGAQILACIADLPSTGGVCDARGLTGAQIWSTSVTVATSGVHLMLGAATFNFQSTATLKVTGNDFQLSGPGESAVLSAAASATAAGVIVTGGRAYVHDFKVVGNRAAGGGSGLISLGGSGHRVKRVTIIDSGAQAIYMANCTDCAVEDNHIVRPKYSAIFSEGTNAHIQIRRNTITDPNLANSGGNGGIGCNGGGSIANQTDIWIEDNYIVFNSGVGQGTGIQCNNADRVWITGNRVIAAPGESIAFTARNAKIAFNEVSNSATGGILAWLTNLASSNIVITNNIAYDNFYYGIQVTFASPNIIGQNITISENRLTQLNGTQSCGIQTWRNGQSNVSFSQFVVSFNQWTGSGSGGPINLDQSIGNYSPMLAGNVGDASYPPTFWLAGSTPLGLGQVGASWMSIAAGAPVGTLFYCIDCVPGTCAGGGPGSLVLKTSSGWSCK